MQRTLKYTKFASPEAEPMTNGSYHSPNVGADIIGYVSSSKIERIACNRQGPDRNKSEKGPHKLNVPRLNNNESTQKCGHW